MNVPAICRGEMASNRRKDHKISMLSLHLDIEATPSEAPAIYETRDGKPSLIRFDLKGGLYVIPKVLDDGYMQVGKAELRFRREN